MTILVTGGAGYIGPHVVSLLPETKEEVIILDNLSTGRKENILYGTLVEGDLADLNLLDELFSKYKFKSVMHFAGSIVVPESVSNPTLYYSNNTLNSLNLIKMCLKHGTGQFIFSSTAAVYGILPSGYADEETPTMPINPYGYSKLMTEWMLRDTAFAHPEFRYVALRYFNVAGASKTGKIGQSTPNATHLLKIASELAVLKRTSMSIFGEDYATADGTCIRDYIHVDDLAYAHIKALEYLNKGGASQVLNCGYGHGASVKEVISAVEKYTGSKLHVVTGPRRAGDAETLVSKADKIKKILNWKPQYDDLDYIVKTAVEWEKKLQ